MNLKLNSPSFLKKVALCFMLASATTGIAQIDTHEVGASTKFGTRGVSF